MPYIDTDKISLQLRNKLLDLQNKRILITNFNGTEQEKDFTMPSNCDGYGRIHHFIRKSSSGWPEDPLPIDPASKALDLPDVNMMEAQVFQIAGCSWRCWYCFVPYELLTANSKYSGWMSALDLIDLYLKQYNRPLIIDLSGGQPDLVPEWTLWILQELTSRGINDKVYVWSDDNLSNYYFFKYLTDDDRNFILKYKNYGRVGCFKGFDPESFSFNTRSNPFLFYRQFDIIKKLLALGLDVYAYVTLTTPNCDSIHIKISKFMDKLQQVHEFLPLRMVPLEIKPFTPTKNRIDDVNFRSLRYQRTAVDFFYDELRARYSKKELSLPIYEVPHKKVSI